MASPSSSIQNFMVVQLFLLKILGLIIN